MKYRVNIIIIFLFIGYFAEGQQNALPIYYRQSLNVDSLIKNTPYGIIFYPDVHVFPRKHPKNRKEREKYQKMVNNFKKVYPYAIEISSIYRQIEDSLDRFKSDKDRKKYLSVREKQIMDYYKPKLTKLTLSQGVMLVKLLDREAGSTAYEMIEQMKGSVRAFFWQNFALMFGNNLKREYDSKGKDAEIEYLVMRYKTGTL